MVHMAIGTSFRMEAAVASAWLGSYLVAENPTLRYTFIIRAFFHSLIFSGFPENYSTTHALTTPDKDNYGLTDLDVRSCILELQNTVKGKIICLVGPPGVGETSTGKSILRALGRQFFRFSASGLMDVAEIKGHRWTYVRSELCHCSKNGLISMTHMALSRCSAR